MMRALTLCLLLAALGSAHAEVPARLSPTCPPEKAGSVLVCQDTGAAGWSIAARERYVTLAIPNLAPAPAVTAVVNLTTPLTSGKTWPYTAPLDGFLQSVKATCAGYPYSNMVFDVLDGATSVLAAPLTLPQYTNTATTTTIAAPAVSVDRPLTVKLVTTATGAASCSVTLSIALPALALSAAPPVPSTLTAARLTCQVAPTLSALAIDVMAAPSWDTTPVSVLAAPLTLAPGEQVVQSTAIALPDLAAGVPLSLNLSARDTGQTAFGCSVNLTTVQ